LVVCPNSLSYETFACWYPNIPPYAPRGRDLQTLRLLVVCPDRLSYETR